MNRQEALRKIDEIRDEILFEKDELESCEENEKEYHIKRIAELEGFISNIVDQYHEQ